LEGTNVNALIRRQKAKGFTRDFADLTVFDGYVSGVLSTGMQLRRASKWLNAISVTVPRSIELNAVLEKLVSLQYVVSVDLVASYMRTRVEDYYTQSIANKQSRSVNYTHDIQYGDSLSQLDQINVVAAHSLGYNGTGVAVLLLDTGFDKAHPALQRSRVIAEHDFVQNDTDVSYEPNKRDDHGTMTFSNIAGWAPGHLIGAAFGASFLLAKTEDGLYEARVEEDNFIAALEWGEENGAQVVSASLGYSDWYAYMDMDGENSPVSRACDQAVTNGMVVVISNGNSGEAGLSSPADANKVISVGAVNYEGGIAGFSARGPSSDGRIKPEVCARGVSNIVAIPASNAYGTKSGTSFSCPLVAGVVAIILQAHPDWSPSMVKEALMRTASHHNTPDVIFGWGVVDAVAAMQFSPHMGCDLPCPLGCDTDHCLCAPDTYDRDCSMTRVVCGDICLSRNGMCQPNSTFRCVHKEVQPASPTTQAYPTIQATIRPNKSRESASLFYMGFALISAFASLVFAALIVAVINYKLKIYRSNTRDGHSIPLQTHAMG
jgi:hypothetical protein